MTIRRKANTCRMRSAPRPRARASLTAAAIFLLLALVVPLSALADRHCTDAERKDGDKWLFLNARDRNIALAKHLPRGTPTRTQASSGDRVLVDTDYIIGYNDDLRVPLWTAYTLDAKGLNRVDGRIECFRADMRIPASSASSPADYDESRFD